MSYILEALKKAQAERQLGALPTIHAPPPQASAPEGDAALRKPIVLALAAFGLLALLAAAAWFWRQPGPGAIAVTRPTAPASPVSPAAPAAPPVPVPAVAVAPAPLPAPAPAPISAVVVPPARVEAPPAAPPPKSGKPAAPDVAPNPASEESVAGVRDLPEPIQRQIPALALGGYIYSRDPAERLLLVDKVLRHEGEEVAPGVTLEKLQPKAAVFSVKGYRYRVPY